MAFNFAQINPAIIDTLKELFAKPTTAWTGAEAQRASLILEAIRIAMAQRKP